MSNLHESMGAGRDRARDPSVPKFCSCENTKLEHKLVNTGAYNNATNVKQPIHSAINTLNDCNIILRKQLKDIKNWLYNIWESNFKTK